MTTLRIFAANNPAQALQSFTETGAIKSELESRGIRFERWATRPIEPETSPDEILALYADDIARLKRENGFQTADVISLTPDNPQKEVMRQKFLDEHRHSEDEVRFFVRGQGLFYLHIGEEVLAVLCQQNDLISVPHGIPHWFDMGPEPQFTCIRLFTNTEGWVAKFTGDDIASRTPRFESLAGAQ